MSEPRWPAVEVIITIDPPESAQLLIAARTASCAKANFFIKSRQWEGMGIMGSWNHNRAHDVDLHGTAEVLSAFHES